MTELRKYSLYITVALLITFLIKVYNELQTH